MRKNDTPGTSEPLAKLKGRGRSGRGVQRKRSARRAISRLRRYAAGAALAVTGAWFANQNIAYPLPASSSDRFGVSEAGALICFYRNLDDGVGGDDYSVSVGDRNLGKLSPGTYFFHYASPGRRIAWVKGEISVSRTLVLNEGDRLFVRIDRKAFLAGYRPGFTLVRPDKAAHQMRGASFAGIDPFADPSACE